MLCVCSLKRNSQPSSAGGLLCLVASVNGAKSAGLVTAQAAYISASLACFWGVGGEYRKIWQKLTITASPTDPAVKNSNGISSLCADSQLITWVNIPPINDDLFLFKGCYFTQQECKHAHLLSCPTNLGRICTRALSSSPAAESGTRQMSRC